MHSIFSTITSFALLIATVLGTYAYVSTQAGYIGVALTQVTAGIAREMHLPKVEGFLVEKVDANGPVYAAGMRGGTTQVAIADRVVTIGGDVVIAVDRHAVNDRVDLANALNNKQIGDNILFTVLRNNSTEDFNVKVEKNPIAPFP